jgi:alkylation response protein AidB-like acyl-CoA dehydrogenase
MAIANHDGVRPHAHAIRTSLGFFQAVKHPLVDVMIQIDEAKSLVYNAACAIDHEPNAQRNMPTWSRPPQVKMLRSPAADQYNSTVA